MMLHHLGEQAAAQRIEDSLIEVYRRGLVRTADLGGSSSTDAFADGICETIARS